MSITDHAHRPFADVERSSAPVAKRRHCLGLFRPRERTEEFKDQLVGINLSEAFTGLHSDRARKRVLARQEVKLAPAEANNSLLGGPRNLGVDSDGAIVLW
jgi:hypothetical protein